MPGNLALGLAGAPVNATSNYLQMFQENLDTYEPEISKARYAEEIKSGKTSASTPFKQWQSLLSKDDKEDIRAEAATKAMVVAMPQAALETVSDALLLKHIPLPASIKQKLPAFLRNAAPKTFIGGKIVGQFLAKTGMEGVTEGAQELAKNVGSAINTGDWSGENLTQGLRGATIGGLAGGGFATALTLPNTFRTEKALDWALGVSTGRLDSDAQKDIAILRNPEIDKSSPEYQEAYSRFSTRNNTDRQHQFDLATIASPTEDQSPSEIKAAKARVSAREDEAHWVLSKLESEDADPIRAQRYQAKTAAQKDFQDSIAQHLQKSAVDWDPSGEKLRARAQEIEDSFSKVEANAKAIGSNLDVAAAKKMALDQLLGTQDKQAQAAEDSFLDALGSSDSAGPLRAKFARQELMRLYPEQNAHLTPWFKDDSTVVEMLNARENEEIDDDTNLDSWLASPEGIKSTTSDKKTDTATEEKPKGLMTVGQRRDAFRLAEDNAEASGDENQKKEFARLKEDVDFWHSVLSDTESNEQDKAEAKAKLPALEGSLLDLATAPVEEKSLNQAANEQNQPPSQASVSNQEVSPTSPESSRTGEGTPFTVVRTMDGGETTQTEQDYINESREIVKSLTGRGEIKMTPEAALQNVEAVRQEIESAPDLTPEQKQQWSSHFDNIPLVVQQLNSTGTTLPTSEPVSKTTTGAPIPIAQPTPVRMGGVTGDLTRTESGEAVFSPTDNSPETVLRVKETSIEKDPATLTVEDFESGDGTPLVSETDKQFSVLPQNERLVRPFFRSEPAPLSPAEQPKRGETQNEIQQTESLREGQSQPLRQGQSSSSSAEGQSSSLQGQEITYQTTAQDGQMAKSSGSYPEDAGSTPAPATPEEAQLRAIRAALPKPPSAVVTEQAATPAPTRTRSDVESSPEGVAIVEKYDRHYEMVSDFELNLGDATRAQAVALTNKLLKAGAITESDAAEALRLAKDKGYDREDAVSEATSVLQGAVEFRKDQQIDELLATPVAEAATPPSSSAIDTAAITADVQANPDAHRRIQGRKREVSREGAVAILTQLPESFTKQDAINIAKDAGMSRERLTKLATLRNDPNSVSSILSGAMDAELGLFDRNAEPTEDAAVPPAIPETNAEVSEKDTTKPAVTPNQSPADRWVYTGMAAFEEKLRGLKGAKYDQLRAALDSDTGRADLQRKLAGIFNIKVQKTLKAGGVLDPVVLEATTEKILYGNVNQNAPKRITKNVMGDLLSNLEQTGDPFRVSNGVAYDASGRVSNQGDPARETQALRDRGLVSESTDGDGNAVNPKSETPTTVTMQGTTDTAPERAANKEEAQKRVNQTIQDSVSEVVQSLANETGDSIYDTTLAVSKLLQDKYGIDVADPVALGWKSPDSKGRVKPSVLKKLTPRSEEIYNTLKAALEKNVAQTMQQNKDEGLLESPAITLDLASIIQANIYDSLVSEDKFKPAIQKAREQKSTAPLMPVLAEIGRNDVANIQSVVQNVLNNGKPFASHRDITSLTQSDMQAVLDSGMLPERVQETLQALVDLNGDGMALLRNSTNEGWRRWSEILGEQIGNRAPVQVMFNLALDPSVTGQGLWKEGTNTVHISPFLTREPGLMESTMLHEMMHPIWDWKVTAFQRGDFSQLNQKELAALSELSGLFDLVNKEAQSRLSALTDPAALSKAQRDLLGASNLREFLNEAINHKPFQDFLAELKDPDAKGKGGLLRRIVNAILRLIRGGDVAVDSILQRSFELSLDLANYTDRELPIAERNKTQIDYFKSLEAERGRPLTLPEYERASVDFALKYPQPRIANTPAEASRLAQETLVPDELDAFNEYQRTKNEPVLASEMVTQAQEVYEAIKANGGITVDVWNGSQPSSGIVVAPFKETETTFSLNEFTASDVKDYMEKFRPLLEVSGMHLGGWVDNDTVYLDVSIVADNEVTATALAQDGNQLATFNLENFTQLNTPDLLAKYGGESGEVSRLRSETRYKDLRGALEQALRRAMGGVQRTDSPNVSGQGAVQERTSPELDLVETLTGETPTAEEAAKILESSPVPTYYDNLTNKGTDPITGIRTAIGRAAKRGNGAGRNAAQGNEGPLVRGADFPDEIRRGDRETHQELERARSGINEALGGSLPFQSLELIKQLTGQANAPEGSELAQTIDALRNKIPVLPNNALEGLKQLSEGMSSKVFVDTKNDSAYKLLSVSDKGSVGGTFPKDIRIRAADDTVVIASEKNPSLLEFLRAVAISNVQGNAVFTEIAGVTEDGDVILKQPYIKGLKPTDNFDNPEDFREALRDLGLSMLSDIGAVSAVGKVGTRYALFDDLHGENVMRDKNGRAQLVDALATRLLSADEYTSVSPYLKDPEVLTSASVENNLNEGAQPLSNLDTQNGNRTRTTLPSSSAGVESRNRGSQIQRKAIRPNAEPNPFVKEGIRQYNSRNGIAPAIEGYYAPMNEQRARDIAAAFEALPVFDKTPKTLEAYAKLEEEIQQQWDYAINEMGVTFEPWVQEGQPYANSREMVRDVRDNKHLWFFTGGEPHPLLNKPDQDGLTGNDKFRAIHDLFGHASEDFQFGARGEENAWIKHSQMFSPLAQKALTTETRGQNSWVNFGPQNYNSDGSKKNIPAADRPFAPQKVALLPEAFADWKIALDSDVLPSVAVSYEKAKGERLETLLDKAVPEAPQTPFLQVNDFEQAKASLANLVLGPNSSIKGRSGIVVNFQYPDYSTAGFLLNPERVRGQRPIEPTKQEALEARVTHALTDDFDRATPSANKVASAPMVVQTIKQADFVTSRQFDKSPVNTFVKLYDDPSSPTGLRWHFVETFSAEGDFITQYSSTDRKPTGRAMGSVITRIGDSAPKTPNVAPAVIQEEAPAPEPVDIEAEQTRILEELDALAHKRDRLLRDQNYKAAGEVYEQIRELEDKFDSSSVAASAPVPFTPMPMSALDVLYKDSESLPKPDKKIKNSAVATTLAEAALKYWGFQLNSSNITPEIEQILVSNGVEEFISALQASGKNAGDWYSTAIEVAMGVAGVIHPEISDVEIAKSIPAFASAKEPDKAAQLVMRIALAVTSQNLNVNQNAGYAEEQYAIFSSTGKFDSSKIYGEKAESISGNLRLANELITRLGFEGAEDFIKADFSVDALQKKASAILGRSVKIAGKLDDSINGAALFGPKIGQGFLQNLMGRFTPVTIDLWMRRTWGRWTGDVVGDGVTDERMAKLLDSARDAGLQLPEDLRTLRTVERKRQNGNPFKTMSSSVSDRLETDPEFRKSVETLAFEFNSKGQAEYRLSGQPVTPEQAAAIAKYNTPEWKAAQKKAYLAAVERGEEKEAKKIQEEAERARTKFVRDQQRVKEQLDQTWKDLSAAGKKPRMPKADWVAAQHQEAGRTEVLVKEVRKFLKPEWSRNAKVIVADLNPIDIPSPQDRRVISRVVNKIREELSNKGYTATNADVQAVLWYPEKDVWAKLRGEEESNLKLSYDDEFITIAEGRGLGDQARTLAERIRADRAARTSGPNDLRPVGRIDQATDGVKATETLASAPVTPAQALPTGFKQTTATEKDRRETTALSRVMIDPEYQGVRDALEGKQYISYDANETTAKANEFLNSPDFNGNLEAAVLSAGSRLPIEQIVMVKGLAIQRAQKAANAARATMLDPSLPIQVRNNASVISTQYQKISDRITDDLMEMGSLAGQELRAFRLLADALVPRTWVKKYKQPIIKAQREKLTNDPVFKDMMARIAIAQKNAADSTTTRMKKALAMAAAKFVKDTSVEEVTAYEDFARAMASGMPVKDDVMKAAIEMVVVSGMETVKKSVAPNEQVDPSFLKQWEDKLRSIASEQLNGIIESRLQGGKVDAEAQADLTEEQKAEAYEQKIMDAWRDFSDFPLAEMVFNLARTTIVASDSPYASLVQKAQFDPAKIKRLQQAVKLSINTKDEIRKSLGDKNMSVESLKLRLQEANPNLTENELGALANAVQEVYNSEVQRASVAALQGIIKAGNRETRKIVDAPMIAKLLPLVNMGAFQDEAVYNALADKFNLPTWTQESADKIEALANGVQALPEGSIHRGEAGQQMLLEILQENIKDSRGGKRVQHYSQIAAALWTAGVLSGPSTQIVNAAGTTFSVFLESLSEATGHFWEAKKRGVSTGQATEYYKDIARAWLFAFGKDANNVSLRAMNEVHTGLTRGTTKFKSEKQEDLSLLELFKFDPRVAIPGNTLMEAITTGQWKAVVPALGDLGLGVAKTMAERVVTGDVKGALRDYVATRKMVGRLMLASDATNSFSASTIKQMMLKRTLMQKAGLSESEVNRQMKEIQKGGDVTIVNAAKAQAEQEAAEGQFGQSGSAQNISKARRVEQLIEQMTYGNEVIEGGRNYAGEITFNGEPSGLIGLVMMETFGNLNKHLGLVAKPINPFPKTISNLLNNSLNYTIYGSFRAYGKNFGSFLPESNEYRKVAPERGSAEFYALQTKAAAGTIALATFAMMLASAFKDRREKKEPFFELHGPGPKDPKMRAQWVGAGHKPFSMRIGEVELRFTDWPGINIPLGMLGTIYDNAVYGDREADLLDQLFTGLAAVMGTTLDRNMLGGASAVFDILSKNTYDGAKQAALGKFASSYVGGFLKPSDIRYFETIATGGYQDTRSLSGWFKSQIPFVGAINGNPALNVLGEPIEVSAWDATAGRLVSLSNTHPILSPLTTAELLIPEPKAYKISDPSSPTRVRPMEAQELYDFTKIYGEAMRNRLTPEMVGGLVEQAKTAPQGAQDRLTKIAESVRNQAQGELMRARDIRKGKENKGP